MVQIFAVRSAKLLTIYTHFDEIFAGLHLLIEGSSLRSFGATDSNFLHHDVDCDFVDASYSEKFYGLRRCSVGDVKSSAPLSLKQKVSSLFFLVRSFHMHNALLMCCCRWGCPTSKQSLTRVMRGGKAYDSRGTPPIPPTPIRL